MSGMVRLHVDAQQVEVPLGVSVAAAVAQATLQFRQSASGQPRAPLCGMGICQECRVTINGRRRLACQTLCQDDMHVQTRP